jgi:hypothetical protein
MQVAIHMDIGVLSSHKYGFSGLDSIDAVIESGLTEYRD